MFGRLFQNRIGWFVVCKLLDIGGNDPKIQRSTDQHTGHNQRLCVVNSLPRAEWKATNHRSNFIPVAGPSKNKTWRSTMATKTAKFLGFICASNSSTTWHDQVLPRWMTFPETIVWTLHRRRLEAVCGKNIAVVKHWFKDREQEIMQQTEKTHCVCEDGCYLLVR